MKLLKLTVSSAIGACRMAAVSVNHHLDIDYTNNFEVENNNLQIFNWFLIIVMDYSAMMKVMGLSVGLEVMLVE